METVSNTELRSMTRNQWSAILSSAGVRASFLTNRHGPCPVCGGRDRFRFDNKQGVGSFFCNHCGAGDGFKLLMLFRGWSFQQAREFVEQSLRIRRTPVESTSTTNFDPQQRRAKIDKILRGCNPIHPGDSVARYLENRGLRLTAYPSDLLCHPHLPYFDGKQLIENFPAMVARIRDAQDRVVGVHRTYLTADGQKAFVKRSKMTLAQEDGALKGTAVKLYPPSELLGLAEGIETALACTEATGIATWSTLSASFLPQVVLPSSVNEIVIFGDRDESGAGQAAATKAADRFAEMGLRVKVVLPPNIDEDWLDVCTKD